MSGNICNTAQGKIQALVEEDIKGEPILSFYGIPYAKPPVGELRFKDPQDPEPWEGIRDGSKQGEGCLASQSVPSPEGFKMELLGSEDCLFLNVFTHQLNKDSEDTPLKPVMFWIHGGAFTVGTSDKSMHGPYVLMTEDIVLVTINYRLGCLGFLQLDDLQVGNAGLKDMVHALKWVRKNIEHFGGDPGNVTIFGVSAGAAAVHYLVLSPLARGLFHKAIAQSGVSLNPWTCGENSGLKLAQAAGFDKENASSAEILEFLQNLPARTLVGAQSTFDDNLHALEVRPFSPGIEKPHPGAFICQSPREILKNGGHSKVPMIMGYTNCEGMGVEIFKTVFSPNFSEEEFVPHFFGLKRNSQEFREVNKKICQFYFGADKADPSNKEALYNLQTDTLFMHGILDAARLHAKMSREPVFLYRMSLETKLGILKTMMGLPLPGVCHGDDLGYFFKFMDQEFKVDAGSPEEIGYKRFLKMWTNFAKTGIPIPAQDSLLNAEWLPVTLEEVNFLDIGIDLVPGKNPDAERVRFWDDLCKNLPEF